MTYPRETLCFACFRDMFFLKICANRRRKHFLVFELRAVEFRLQGSSRFLAEFAALFGFDVVFAKADDLLLWMTKMFSAQR